MHPLRKQKLLTILIIFLGVSTAASLILYALKQNINVYYTPSQLMQGETRFDKTIRIGGLVKKGSIQHSNQNLMVKFVITDMHKEINVVYTGVLPDLFREEKGIIAQGKMTRDGFFKASEVLAKHDEKYMPPTVAAPPLKS